ncbi:TetR/AcrR family transcriptional regulator [Burkholderia stagnalis]
MKAANSDAEPLPGRQREQLPDRKRQAPKGMSWYERYFPPDARTRQALNTSGIKMAKSGMPRREEFLTAALQRFARYGYVATSTRELCADLGIVPSAIYNYFPSKEAVILAIEDREMSQMLGELEGLDRELRDDAGGRLVAIVKYVATQAIIRRESWRLMAEMLRSLKPENRSRVIARRDAVEKIVRAALAAAVAAKLIPSQDVKLACLQLFSMAEGMSGWYKEGSEYTAEQIASHAAGFFLRAIGAEILLQSETTARRNTSTVVAKADRKALVKRARE